MTSREEITRQREVALVDLIDRLLAGGVVIGGDITLSIADVDLVYVGLRALITSVGSAEKLGMSLGSDGRSAFRLSGCTPSATTRRCRSPTSASRASVTAGSWPWASTAAGPSPTR
jgi:hypothetical protein